jgi:hypothetical protein
MNEPSGGAPRGSARTYLSVEGKEPSVAPPGNYRAPGANFVPISIQGWFVRHANMGMDI